MDGTNGQASFLFAATTVSPAFSILPDGGSRKPPKPKQQQLETLCRTRALPKQCAGLSRAEILRHEISSLYEQPWGPGCSLIITTCRTRRRLPVEQDPRGCAGKLLGRLDCATQHKQRRCPEVTAHCRIQSPGSRNQKISKIEMKQLSQLGVAFALPLLLVAALSHIQPTLAAGGRIFFTDGYGFRADRKLYQIHGVLLWFAFGLVFPVGIIVAKYCKTRLRQHWLSIHVGLQVLGVAATTAGLVIAITKFDAFWKSLHSKVGFVLAVIIWAQFIIGLARPRIYSPVRAGWYFTHWLLGTGSVILGWYTIYKGLKIYERDSGDSLHIFFILFVVEISVVGFVYLLLDRWDHLWHQTLR